MSDIQRANIRTPSHDHRRRCRGPGLDVSEWGFAGDVRRCVHGVVQLGYEVPGTVPCYWRDLHPLFAPFLYRRARRALDREEPA